MGRARELSRKVIARVREQGPRGALASLVSDASRRVVDRNRVAIVLRVELGEPSVHVRPRDRVKGDVALLPFDRRTLPRVVEMLRREEPARIPSVHTRFGQGMSGFVAEIGGEIAGYVFWVEGATSRLAHADLEWLGVAPGPGEIYAFDYFVAERLRGAGNLFVRSVQEAHHHMGYTAAYGYVYAHNRPALWLYRTTGWKEIARVTEHRVLSRIAIAGGAVYRMQPLSRTKLFSIR